MTKKANSLCITKKKWKKGSKNFVVNFFFNFFFSEFKIIFWVYNSDDFKRNEKKIEKYNCCIFSKKYSRATVYCWNAVELCRWGHLFRLVSSKKNVQNYPTLRKKDCLKIVWNWCWKNIFQFWRKLNNWIFFVRFLVFEV